MVVTPGPPSVLGYGKSDVLTADEADVNRTDPINYEDRIATDADGRITLPVLIPGERLIVSPIAPPKGSQSGPRFARNSR